MSRDLETPNGFSVINLLLIILLLVTTFGMVYFYVNYGYQKALNSACECCNSENTKPEETTQKEMREALDQQNVSDTDNCPVCAPCPQQTLTVYYTAEGLFSQAEKDELNEKVLNPLVDFEKDNQTIYTSAVIEKIDISGYRYKIDLYGKNKTNPVSSGFLYGSNDPLEFWIPECMDECEFTQSFKLKYPDVVAKYEENLAI